MADDVNEGAVGATATATAPDDGEEKPPVPPADGETTAEETTPEEIDEDEEEEIPNAAQRRIDEVTREKYALRVENESLKRQLVEQKPSGEKRTIQDWSEAELFQLAESDPRYLPMVVKEVARREVKSSVQGEINSLRQETALPTVLDSVNAELGDKYGSWRDTGSDLRQAADQIMDTDPMYRGRGNDPVACESALAKAYRFLEHQSAAKAARANKTRKTGKQGVKEGAGLGTTASAPTTTTASAAKLLKLQVAAIGKGYDSWESKAYARAIREMNGPKIGE